MSIANVKCFGAPKHQRPNVGGFSYAAPPFSAHISAIYLPPLGKHGWIPFADLCMQRLATKHNAEFTEGARKTWYYFNPFVDLRSCNFETI